MSYLQQVVAVVKPGGKFQQQVSALYSDVATLKTQFNTLVSDAPETLDTLNEIAAAISDDPAFFTTMATANTTLQNNIDALATAAATARTALQAALQASIDANLLTSNNAESALSTRLDALELDPVSRTYVDNAITALTDSAPAALDTLNELAAALGDDENFATTVTNQIAAVQADVNQNEADADAAIAAVQADVDANEADRKTYFKWDSNLTKVVNPLRSSEIEVGNNIHIDPAAGYATQFDGNVEFDNNTVLSHGGTDLTATFAEINGFDARLDTLEADPTTAAAVAAVQADVDQNEADADAAIAAVQADVDQNEADADAAIAAVQADVDQNEADADAAIALKAPLADPDFTGVLEVDTNARLEFADNLTKLHNVLRGTSINIGNNIEIRPAAAGGRVEITGDLLLDISDVTNAADDTAAATAGVAVGQIYRNGSALMIRVS